MGAGAPGPTRTHHSRHVRGTPTSHALEVKRTYGTAPGERVARHARHGPARINTARTTRIAKVASRGHPSWRALLCTVALHRAWKGASRAPARFRGP